MARNIKSHEKQPRLLYLAKLLIRIKGQIKSFPDKTKLKEFIITTPLKRDSFKKKKIKTMNNKWAKNTYLSTIDLKNKLS